MTYSIYYSGMQARGLQYVTSFRVDSADNMMLVQVGVPHHRALSHCRSAGREVDEAALVAAVTLSALPRIESSLQAGVYDAVMLETAARDRRVDFELDSEELDAACHGAPKSCGYAVSHGGDQFCEAGATPGTGALPTRSRLPTTTFLCGNCALPDARIVCSHLHHVMVQRTGTPTESVMNPWIGFCDLGRGAEASPPARCKPGGHECWRRLVAPAQREQAHTLSPLALHEAFGYLDSVWQNTFGVRLLGSDLLLAGGALATPCVSKQDFVEKFSAVVGAFDAFDVPGAGRAATLTRMADHLNNWARGRGLPEESFALVAQSIDVLKKVARLRAWVQHPSSGDARRDSEEAQRVLGISLPAISYSDEWCRVVARVSAALATIREFLRANQGGVKTTDPSP